MDESTNTIGKRLASIGVDNTEENRQAYRGERTLSNRAHPLGGWDKTIGRMGMCCVCIFVFRIPAETFVLGHAEPVGTLVSLGIPASRDDIPFDAWATLACFLAAFSTPLLLWYSVVSVVFSVMMADDTALLKAFRCGC